MSRRAVVESYYDYVLASERWARLRTRLLVARGRRCERCGVLEAARDLDLHHLTYDRLGFERDDDLQVVCRPCHYLADREREAAARRRAEGALYEARLHGWASKRYGEDWYWHCDPHEVGEAFDAWLERHDDR